MAMELVLLVIKIRSDMVDTVHRRWDALSITVVLCSDVPGGTERKHLPKGIDISFW